MSGVVMMLCGQHLGGGVIRPLPHDGQFLRSFDFEAHEGVGEIVMTAEIGEAMVFADVAEAIEFRNRSPECCPLRPDGQPNRPLTSTNWRVMPCGG